MVYEIVLGMKNLPKKLLALSRFKLRLIELKKCMPTTALNRQMFSYLGDEREVAFGALLRQRDLLPLPNNQQLRPHGLHIASHSKVPQ